MEAGQAILIRVGAKEVILAETLADNRARLIAIPTENDWLSIFDVVEFDPSSAIDGPGGVSYQFNDIRESNHYRAYDAWVVLHRQQAYENWLAELDEGGIVVEEVQPAARNVHHVRLAIPPGLSALTALVRLSRTSRNVEVVAPALAAAADDVDRAKSDLERAVGWGASDVALTKQIGKAFAENTRLDVAVQFWERLTHLLPDDVEAHARLGSTYGRLGVPTLAAQAYDRAATLAEAPELRRQLERARDLMWEKSKT